MSNFFDLLNNFIKIAKDLENHPTFQGMAADVANILTSTVSVVAEVTTNPVAAVTDAASAVVQEVDSVTGAPITPANTTGSTPTN